MNLADVGRKYKRENISLVSSRGNRKRRVQAVSAGPRVCGLNGLARNVLEITASNETKEETDG